MIKRFFTTEFDDIPKDDPLLLERNTIHKHHVDRIYLTIFIGLLLKYYSEGMKVTMDIAVVSTLFTLSEWMLITKTPYQNAGMVFVFVESYMIRCFICFLNKNPDKMEFNIEFYSAFFITPYLFESWPINWKIKDFFLILGSVVLATELVFFY